LRPIILAAFPTASLSGGYKRLYEILKRGKAEGIDYIVLTDSESCENAAKIFPDFPELLRKYRVIKRDFGRTNVRFPVLKQACEYKRILSLAFFISKVAKEENADLIVYPSQGTWGVLSSYLASLLCSKPWTAIFQPGASMNQPNLFQPSYSLGPLNLSNILAHVEGRTQACKCKISTISKIGLSIDFLILLKAAEKSVMLTVSHSVVEDFGFLDPRIKLLPITPGNGIDPSEFGSTVPKRLNYQSVFFGRLIPEKGLSDLVEMWKLVVEKVPEAKLAVCGIVEEAEILEKFLVEISDQNLGGNIEFLGQQSSESLFNIVRGSCLTVNPSYVDSFSLTTLESLACGTPVVSYELPASRHNFGNCKAVFQCPVGNKTSMADKILYVLNKIDRKTLAMEAKKFAASYDWSKVIKAEKYAYRIVINLKREPQQGLC
jgi:glycosyltransferase involved in cell wall biosynthesis